MTDFERLLRVKTTLNSHMNTIDVNCEESEKQFTQLVDLSQDLDEIIAKERQKNQFIEKPQLGVDCVIWCGGEPKIDRLTDEDHHEPYWEESLYAFGDEDCFIVLEKPITQK